MVTKNDAFALPAYYTSDDIKRIRKQLGLTQSEFAGFLNVSPRTVENWELKSSVVRGASVPMLKILEMYPEAYSRLLIPERRLPIRLWYMYRQDPCTLIDVDDRLQLVEIKNFTIDRIYRAFGTNEMPNYQDYRSFLETRTFPASRDKMKLVLNELDLPFYDPFMIIEKTEGRMAEDEFWIKIERN